MALASIADVLQVEHLGAGDTVDVLIEVPHGATRTVEYEALARRLKSPLPPGLVDFFHVNTDSGAPELALALAQHLAADGHFVAVLRCQIPRTFIDCNRRLDVSLDDFKAGGVAPGLMPWVTDADDVALLRARYDAYVGAVRAASLALPEAGAMLLLHSYAPRTVGVEVDLDIVDNLHAAYAPDVALEWPERPAMDVIARGPDGVFYAPEAVVETLEAELAAMGLGLGMSATYSLHPSTLGYEHVTRRPGRGLCLEVRRDLFVERFEPFQEARIAPERVMGLAAPIARALRRWW